MCIYIYTHTYHVGIIYRVQGVGLVGIKGTYYIGIT